MAKAPQFRNVSVKLIKRAKYNPKSRLSKNGIRTLARSIGKVGLLYPILINSHNELIDGHRRLEACIYNGYETIPALVVEGDACDMYSEVNIMCKRMSGRDKLGIFLVEPKAVSSGSRRYFQEMVDMLGMDLCTTIYNNGFSPFIYRMARDVCVSCGMEKPELVKRTVQWFMTCESFSYVRSLLISKIVSPALILRHVKKNHPLKMKVV